jgi:hypothetical protein
MKRRQFLSLSFLTFILSACGSGGGGSDDETPSGQTCSTDNLSGTIAANHGHTLTVTHADVVAAADKTYDITGSAGHAHSVTVTAADFADLANDTSITLTSTSGSGHSHSITVTCA